MSYKTRMLLPVLGMILIAGFSAINVLTNDQEIELSFPPALTNLADAKRLEIKNAEGQVVLTGDFGAPAQKGDETERKAVLTGTEINAEAQGKAEIEISQKKNGAAEQELELTVEQLAPGVTFKLFLDNQEIGSFTTNVNGKAEVEISGEQSK